MLRTTKAATATAVVLAVGVAAGCGGDDGGLFDEGDADVDDLDDFDDFDDFDDLDDFDDFASDDGPDVDWDGPVELDLDFDELRAVVTEEFDGADIGRGSARWGTYAEVFVDVRAGELGDDELLAGCEGLTDWLFDRPEDEALGPVIIEVGEGESGMASDEFELVVVNEGLIPREERGSCELT